MWLEGKLSLSRGNLVFTLVALRTFGRAGRGASPVGAVHLTCTPRSNNYHYDWIVTADVAREGLQV
jgi:hypothetical protein